MKLKVKETFKDKYTGDIYEEGKIIDVKKERGEELLKSPYVVVDETKPSKPTSNENTAEKANDSADSAENTAESNKNK